MVGMIFLDDRGVLDLDAFQQDVHRWANENFGEITPIEPLLGMVEELGELCHTVLKNSQDIRGMGDDALARLSMEDALGDLCVFMANFAAHAGIRLERAIVDTWAKVRERDWRQFPANGISE